MANNDHEIQMPVNPNPNVELGMSVVVGDSLHADRAEAWAVGERRGVPVEPGDPTYQNNSKWYAEQTEQYLQRINKWIPHPVSILKSSIKT